jgi:hypothetical protein
MMLPRCDFCRKIALYDGKTHMGLWAYMCEDHFRLYGAGIGPEKGQVLVLANPRSDLLPAPDGVFAIAGQVCALLRKSGKPCDANDLAWQLFQCDDRESAYDLLRQYVHMHELTPAPQPGGPGIKVKIRNLINC